MARVFVDKVKGLSFRYRAPSAGVLSALPVSATQPAILGVVIAHEIGHLLLGAASHRTGGIMAPVLAAPTVLDGYRGRLQFDPGQSARLRFEVMARALHGRGFALLRKQAPGILECDLLAPAGGASPHPAAREGR
jgi:hypothetical protein